MEKLRTHSPSLPERNFDKIAELFPGVITESRDADGAAIRAVDFDLLRQELAGRVVEGPRERYQLDWPGKREALFTANAPVAKTLRPDRAASAAIAPGSGRQVVDEVLRPAPAAAADAQHEVQHHRRQRQGE